MTAAGTAVVNGDVGSCPTPSITGAGLSAVPPFIIHPAADAVVCQAQTDATAAVGFITPQACTTSYGPGDQNLGGLTLTPGVYCFASTASITGTVTLDALGDPDAVWIFKIESAITTASSSNVALSNGADSCNVFWQLGTAATLGTGSTFRGTIFAGSSIGLGTTANLVGRAVAQTGAVTMDGSNTVGECSTLALAPTTLISTQASPGVTLGAAITDTKTLSGGVTPPFQPTGTITFNLYGPNDANCTGDAIFTSTVPVNGTGNYVSDPFTPATPGTYRWIANYSGDANNNATANVCNEANENVVVSAPGTAVPTLNEWGVIIFVVLVGLMSIYYLRRQKAKA